MFNHTQVSNNDVHAFRRIPCWPSGVAVQSAKHSGQRLRFTCSHFREIIYVEALLPRPHMPGQICPRTRLKEGNQSQRSWVGRRGARGRRRMKPSVDRECWKRPDERKSFPKIYIVFCVWLNMTINHYNNVYRSKKSKKHNRSPLKIVKFTTLPFD